MAQPVLDERLLPAAAAREPATAEFAAPPPPGAVFQTKIAKPSIRDHLREYRVRVLNDGIAVQKRFVVGR